MNLSDFLGSLHFLTLIALTGTVIEARIAPLPQWCALPAMGLFVISIFGYAALVVLAYT